MNLKQYIQENPTATLADAQAYPVTIDTKQVGSGQARGLFITEMGAGDYSSMTLWTVFSAAAADINSSLFSLASAIIITASDGSSYFGMDDTKADGIGNRAALDGLVAGGVMTQATADKFIAKTLSTTYPFATATQEEFDAANVPEPEFTEVAYVEEGHINQHLVKAVSHNSGAIELNFNITDDTTNVNFEIKTLSCTDLSSVESKNNINNYQPVSAKWLTRMGDSTSMIDHLEKNFAIKSVVKIFVKPSVNCEFTCVAR